MRGFGGGSLSDRSHLEEQDIEGRIILKLIFQEVR